MRIAGRYASIHGAHVDRGCHAGFGYICLVQVNRSRHPADAAMDVGYAQVPDVEVNLAVLRVAGPGRGLRQGQGRRQRQNADHKCQTLHRKILSSREPPVSAARETLAGARETKGKSGLLRAASCCK